MCGDCGIYLADFGGDRLDILLILQSPAPDCRKSAFWTQKRQNGGLGHLFSGTAPLAIATLCHEWGVKGCLVRLGGKKRLKIDYTGFWRC
jgi:hypothetical protein